VAACARASTPYAVVGCIRPDVHAGDRLVVTADDARGSLGDTVLDSTAVAQARARLALESTERRSATGIVGADGETLFVHVVRNDTFPICIFGNGHVGRALVQVLGAVPADVWWIDTREHDFPEQVPSNVEIVVTDDPAAEVTAAPRGASLVVMTHSHPLDFEIIETALAREDWAYVGLIGSKSKRAQFERRLLARGAAPESLRRLTCPIGAGPLRSKVPGVIAVAVAAELLAIRESSAVRPASGDGLQPRAIPFRGRSA
jgi:xanthine dehydrogenase accessory factor